MITVTLVKYPAHECCVTVASWDLRIVHFGVCSHFQIGCACLYVFLYAFLSQCLSQLVIYSFIYSFLCCCCCRLIPSWTWRKQQVCLYTRHLPLCQSVGPSVWTIVVCQSVCLQFLVTTSERLSPCVFISFAKFACSKLGVIICVL